MPLEACMIVIDNSEYMRNGDYAPNRFDAQADAVSVIFGHKTDSNPENTAGVMTMAGKGPEVLVTPTQDVGKILTALHNTRLHGSVDLITGIQVAQLALKHRQNKNLRQRIVAFVGSPLDSGSSTSSSTGVVDEKSLVKVGKKLKKNNIALDIIAFGEWEENEVRLKALVDAVQSGENSHYLTITPGSHLLSDIVLQSPIIRDPTDPAAAGGAEGGGSFEFGVDPSMDPELAMALRMSMEEEQARLRASGGPSDGAAQPSRDGARTPTQANPNPTTNPAIVATGAAVAGGAAVGAAAALATDDDDDILLAQALAMSKAEGGAGGGDVEMGDEDISEEEAIERAIAMSMEKGGEDEEEEEDDDDEEEDDDEEGDDDDEDDDDEEDEDDKMETSK